MVQTDENWLSPQNDEAVNTKTNFDSPISEMENKALVLDTYTSAPLSSPPDDMVKAVEAVGNSQQLTIHNPQPTTDTIGLADLDDIYQSGDFSRLHPYLENGSLVVLPKEQLTEFMAQMRDNMVLLNGLNTLAEGIKPIVQESDEGKAILGFLTSNSGLFSGKEIGVVEAMKLATGIPALLRNFKALLGNVDVNLLRENAAFVDEFRAVLRRNNSPFLTTISSLGDGLNQLKQ